ncbi:polygalacturonan/rhamnogalacturonan ABC transporter permease [Blautia hominis]|uniref:Polygalacturonan/rhamnogalacturonan ABC transporter permease n=1 Tax=Blautia hominis TaxID=2025493 RepID=A0ABQ0B548_9FIRM
MKRKKIKVQSYYHFMLMPGMILLLIFAIIPMFGTVIAFQNYIPSKGILGSAWVGLDNFKRLFMLPDFKQILGNTFFIAIGKLVLGTIGSIIFALLLNECRMMRLKKTVQTAVYLPHFLSWVILAVMFSNLFSLTGVVNQIVTFFGGEPTMFLISNKWFRPLMILGETWKEFGYGAIIYVAAMTSIDPTLYEAAGMDGAGRWKRMLHVTLPGIIPQVVLMTILNIGQVLNAGFDQIFNLYSPLVYETGDIIDTYVYRVGMINQQFSLATTVGLFKSVISFILLFGAYKLADKLLGYKVF